MPIYTDPGYIADVVGDVDPPTAEWANAIRDRVIHHFSTTGDRDTAIPSPTAGMVCFITGTSTLQFYVGSAWLSYDLAVQTYTPTLSQGASGNIAKTVNEGRYVRRWNTCEAWVNLSPSAAGTAGSAVAFSLPATAVSHGSAQTFGNGLYVDASVGTYLCEVIILTTTTARWRANTTGAIVGVNPNMAVASGDTAIAHVEYVIA